MTWSSVFGSESIIAVCFLSLSLYLNETYASSCLNKERVCICCSTLCVNVFCKLALYHSGLFCGLCKIILCCCLPN